MATSIRGKRVARGASAGGVGTPRVRSGPSVQNTVIPRRGIVSYNPLEGASQVGAQLASRIEGHGKMLNEFFGSLAQSTMGMLEIEHHSTIADIRYKNRDQKLEAVQDHVTSPEEDPAKWLNDDGNLVSQDNMRDRDYYETRIALHAGDQATKLARQFIEDGLTQTDMSTDFGTLLSSQISKDSEGMDGIYKTFFVSAYRNAVKPAIDDRITDLAKAKVQEGVTDLTNNIINFTSGKLASGDFVKGSDVKRFMVNSQTILPYMREGNRKAFVLGAMIEGVRTSPPKDRAGHAANLAVLLAENPDFGDGKTSFSKLHPQAYKTIIDKLAAIKNDNYKILAQPIVDQIENARVALADPTKTTGQKLTMVSDIFKTLSDPDVQELGNVPILRKATLAFYKAADALFDDTNVTQNVVSFLRGDAVRPNDNVVAKADKLIAPNYLNPKFIDPTDVVKALSDPNLKLPNFYKQIANSISNSHIATNKVDDPNVMPHLKIAEANQTIIETAVRQGMSREDLRSKIGPTAYAVWDMASDLLQSSDVSVQTAIHTANSSINSGATKKYMEALSDDEMKTAVLTAVNESSLVEAINDVFDGPSIMPWMTDNIMADVKRKLAIKQVDLTDKSAVEDAFEEAVKESRDQFVVLNEGEKGETLFPKFLFSKKQRLLLEWTDHLGNKVNSIELIPKQWGKYVKGRVKHMHITHGAKAQYEQRQSKKYRMKNGMMPEWFSSFVEQQYGDGPLRILDPTGPEDVGHGSVPVSTNSEHIMFKPNMTITWDDDKKSLEIIPDSKGPNTISEGSDPYEAFFNGGKITTSMFKQIFNDISSAYGFSLLDRSARDAGARALTLQYQGRILSEEEKIRLRKLHHMELEERRKNPRHWGGLGPLKNTKDWNLFNLRKGEFKGFTGSFFLNDSDSSVVTDEIKEITNELSSKDSQTSKNKLISQAITKAVDTGKEKGQVNPSVGITTALNHFSGTISSKNEVLDHLMEKLTSKHAVDFQSKLIRQNSVERKAGHVNEASDIPITSSYVTKRMNLIRTNEGIRKYAYLDSNGNPTVGLGFLMTNSDNAEIIKKLVGADYFAKMKKEAYLKDDRKKKYPLTDNQIDQIYETIIPTYEAMVSKWYKGVEFSPTQRAVFVDMAYRGGSKLLGPGTKFHKAVHRGDWDAAIYELEERSNPKDLDGVSIRNKNNSQDLQLSLNGEISQPPALMSMGSNNIFNTALRLASDAITVVKGAFKDSHHTDKEIINPDAHYPVTKAQNQYAFDWVLSVLDSLDDKKTLEKLGQDLGVNFLSAVTDATLPTESSRTLWKDVVLKNILGVKMSTKTMTEADVSSRTLLTLKELARTAYSKGKRHITWDDYGDTMIGDVRIKALIGGGSKADKKAASEAFPRNAWGFAKLGFATIIDSRVDVAFTIGQASLHIDKNGNTILTDTYDAEKYKWGSGSEGIYGFLRDFLGKEGRLTLENQKDNKIKWKINLGKLV